MSVRAEKWYWGKLDANILFGAAPPVHRVILVTTGEKDTALTPADKALIAAAPNLKAACEVMLDAFDRAYEGCDCGECEAVRQAEAASARAKGEA